MSDFPKDAPSIKDAKPRKKTNVKNYPGLGYAPTIKEVAPPGFGHTKGDDKGGTAAAFDRARKEGRFKGSKSDMFAIMWSQKEKGDKPHYKPGTDKKYKKYQEDYMAHAVDEQLDDLLSDPLEELYTLFEAEMNVLPKPELQADMPAGYEGPHKGQFEHPVTKKRNEIDSLIAQGQDPVSAHSAVHGDIDTSNVSAKGALAGTLGRIQDDELRRGVKVEYDKNSILARDAKLEKEQDAVTFDDLRTPMNQQVPDNEQPMPGGVKEETEECYDYMDDVKYLQTYGRA